MSSACKKTGNEGRGFDIAIYKIYEFQGWTLSWKQAFYSFQYLLSLEEQPVESISP